MKKEEALALAKSYLFSWLDVQIHDSAPSDVVFYGVDLSNVFLFSFGLPDELRVGSGRYVAVSKEDGSVRYLGMLGK